MDKKKGVTEERIELLEGYISAIILVEKPHCLYPIL
jgi:hypothetical protein